LTARTWTHEQLPVYNGTLGDVVHVPATTSSLLNAAALSGSPSTEKPTIFRFDL
jgi:hypothetical protein